MNALQWNGIAPFKQKCDTAPGYIIDKPTANPNYVLITRICSECKLPFTREVRKTHAERTENCGARDCKLIRNRRLNLTYKIRKALA